MVIKHTLRTTQVPNWIYVHKDPQVGDYAVHRTAQGAIIRYEIRSIEDDRIEVSQRIEDTGMLFGSGLDEFEHRVFVNSQGFVREAYLLEDDGRRTELPIAVAGQNGHIGRMGRYSSSGLLHVDAGYFAVTEVRAFEMWTMTGLTPGTITVVHYGNPEVKFGVVKIAGYESASLSIGDLTDFLQDAGGGIALSLLVDYLSDRYMKIEAELIEQGNSLKREG